MKISSATILLLALTVPCELRAQVPLAAGDEVRIRDRRGLEHEGVIVTSTPDEIRMTTRAGDHVVPHEQIATLERSVGQQRRFGRNFLLTVGVMAGVGAVMSATTWEPCTGFCILHPESRTEAFTWGLAGGALLGAPIGLIVGLAVKSERWESIPMPASPGLALSLRRSSRGLDFVASIPVGGGGR